MLPGDAERLLARLQAAEAALRASEDRFRAVFDFAPVGMALVALDGHFLQVNAALRGLLRCSAQDLADLKHTDLTLPEDRSTEAARLADLLAGHATAVQFEKRYRNTAGQVFWALASVSLLGREAPNAAVLAAAAPNAAALHGAADGPCFLYQIQDLSEQKAAQQQLQHRAYHDDLTGLPNRALLRELTASWIQSAQRHGNRFALVLTDLDHFKDANDRFGHAAGDEVLRVTAQRQREALRKSDVVGRLGGDEFAALLADVSGAQDVFGVVRKMALRVAVPVQHHHRAINVGLSAGVALFPVDGSDVDTLFRCADTALYRAKSLGRGRTCFFSDADEKQVHQHDADAAPLAAALVNDRLGLHCLSAVPLQVADEDDDASGPPGLQGLQRHPAADTSAPAAAVLSWHSPHLGLARHEQINAIAQAHGLGDDLGVWMVRHALLALQQADAAGRPQDVALYFTPRQLRSTALLGRLQAAVAASGVPASRLVVVFPTGQLPQLAPPTVAALGRWRSVGFGFAFSDLGAQEIPLGALMQWKPRWVELADSLVASARLSARTAELVKSLCEIARCLDVKVGARGEASAEHDRWLGSLGCNWRVVGPDGPGLPTELATSLPEA